DELRGHLISSMIYPLLLAFVGAGSIFVMMNFVVPKFAQVFTESRIAMPTPTYLLVKASELLRSYFWLSVVGIVAVVVGFRRYIATEHGRRAWDAFKLRVPV